MAKRSVAPLLIGTTFQRASSGASTVILGLFLAQLSLESGHGINSLQVGLLPVAFYITELSLAPIMGGLSDRWGRRVFMVVGPLTGLVQIGLLTFTPTTNPLPYLLGLQVLSGLSGAMTTPAILSYLADCTAHSQEYRMRVMSLYELVTSGGIAVGVVIGGVAWDRLGRLSFVLLAAIYLLVALCMALAPVVAHHASHGNIHNIAQRYWRIIRTPRLFIFIPAWICINALVGIWFSSQLTFILSKPVPQHIHQFLMGSMSGPDGGHRMSIVLGLFVLFFAASLLFWAFNLTRIPRLRLMLTSIAGTFLACFALFGLNHHHLNNPHQLLLWIPLLALGVFAETSFAPSALAYLADISEESARDRGLMMGLYSIFLGLGQILGNGLGGVFARGFGFDGLIYLTIILASVALISLLWLFQQEQRASIPQIPPSHPASLAPNREEAYHR